MTQSGHKVGPRHGPWGSAAGRPALVVAGDVLLALLIGGGSSAVVVHEGQADVRIWLVVAGLALPLALRRTAPVLALSAMFVTAAVQLALGERTAADLALLVGLFTVASSRPRRQALIAAAVLEGLAIAAAFTIGPGSDGRVASVLFSSGLIAAAFFAGVSLQERRSYLASVLDRAERLEREQAQQAQLAVTEERNRIAREMHDIVAHSLSVMITLAEAARAATAAPGSPASDAMAQVAQTGRDAMTEMRRLLGVLRDDTATPLGPQPSLDGLEELVEQARGTGLPASLTTAGRPSHVPVALQATVYRIVQEALTNALKHARQATGIAVTLAWSPDQLLVTVQDDGRAEVGDAGAVSGHGLIGMRERVGIFGGDLVAGPTPEGWRVEARLPLDHGAPA